MSWTWVSRRWLDFRMGHATYLIFALSISNFILIAYNFLVSEVSFLNQLFPELWSFALVASLVYVPVAILIGHWHKNNQLKTDMQVAGEENPYFTKILQKLDAILEAQKNG